MRNSADYQKGKNLIECSIENFASRGGSYQTESCTIPLNSRQPKNTLSEKKKWTTSCWILLQHFIEGLQEYDAPSSTPEARGGPEHVIEEKPIEDKPPSVVTKMGGDTMAKNTNSKKGTIGSKLKGNYNEFTHQSERSQM